ncbi:hypothetical protein A3I48_02760 [Candidatus Daviesbacteria bacterium RIFCSPLOWO2_02_FULL_36_7]|uniref:L-threonylcarbamoyladenylate synthase n=1 Tax=Candidatus Daviesbacteria bacterium RIFCSPLOWO2_02_FULL_36_7 TaxID=1797792 RepID=A0A1F5MHM0_9BACT|nr:MAG: hypothetical protein A3I48_02760 [Candidatus Daviesbacteria bacterium RIFCSPLOWO2_02_FULL_36_7]
MVAERTLGIDSVMPSLLRGGFAEKLKTTEPDHLIRVAEMIREGGIVAFPFNGIYGLFGDIDNVDVVEDIVTAKNRPKDKKLIAVTTPETIDMHSDLARTKYPKEQIANLLKDIYALGVILPASTRAPYHLVIGDGIDRTLLTIWTEYPPLRTMIEHLYILGGRGLVGTSANKSGEATHFNPDSLYLDFGTNVRAVVYDYFDHLSAQRRKSTTIIDLTNNYPRLHREGNVSEEEIREALKRHNFPELKVGRDVIEVRARAS